MVTVNGLGVYPNFKDIPCEAGDTLSKGPSFWVSRLVFGGVYSMCSIYLPRCSIKIIISYRSRLLLGREGKVGVF